MEIAKKYLNEETITNGKIPAHYVLSNTKRKFEEYKLNDYGTVFGNKLIKEENVFYNSNDVFNSIVRLGKKCCYILKNDLLENQEKKNIQFTNTNNTNEEELTFISLNDIPKERVLLSNTYIHSFLTVPIFMKNFEKLKPIIEEFCSQNGFPYLETDSSDEENGQISTIYYFNSHPFISLSIIIYILFETQDCLKTILKMTSSSLSEKCFTLKSLTSNGAGVEEKYTRPLNNVLWFFYGKSEIDYNSLNVYNLLNSTTSILQMIENETSYIKYSSSPKFFYSQNRFGIEENHENLISIAWSKLKLSFLESGYKKCKNPKCGVIFEPNSREDYCSTCIGEGKNKNVNSNTNYRKKQELHKKLVLLYRNTSPLKLDSMDNLILDDIKKYISFTKATDIKRGTNIEDIEKYISLLSE